MTSGPSADMPAALEHYLRMWNERRPDQIRVHLERAVSAECEWIDPRNQHVGREALEANVRSFRAKYANADLSLGSDVDGHNGRYRYEWIIVDDGSLLLRGMDVVTLDEEGRLVRVDGFFGTLERIGPA